MGPQPRLVRAVSGTPETSQRAATSASSTFSSGATSRLRNTISHSIEQRRKKDHKNHGTAMEAAKIESKPRHDIITQAHARNNTQRPRHRTSFGIRTLYVSAGTKEMKT